MSYLYVNVQKFRCAGALIQTQMKYLHKKYSFGEAHTNGVESHKRECVDLWSRALLITVFQRVLLQI